MIHVRDARGRSVIEMIVEMLIIVAIAPAVLCCIVQAITAIAAIALPWLAVTVIAIGLAACLAAAVAAGSRHRAALPPSPALPAGDESITEPILPIRRPPGLPPPGREH